MLAPPRSLRDRRSSWLTLVCLVVLVVVAVTALWTADNPTLKPGDPFAWSDNFSGPAGSAAKSDIWKPAVGGDGWGNGELECYTGSRNNSALDGDGHLVITARYAPGHRCSDGRVNDYTSARLRTETLKSMLYGHVRVRAELPTGTGAWPAIWAMGVDHSRVGWPESGEIDIAEVVGSQPTSLYTSVHGPDPQGNPYDLTHATAVPSLPSHGWHVYGLDWTPDSLTFTLDGRKVYSLTRAQVAKAGEWVFDQPFYLLVDVAVGGSFPGPPSTPTVYPQRMSLDYVHVYR